MEEAMMLFFGQKMEEAMMLFFGQEPQ